MRCRTARRWMPDATKKYTTIEVIGDAGLAEADDLYLVTHPTYFETQRRDLWFYERLWAVLLRQLEKRHEQRTLIEFGSGPGFLCALAERRWLAGAMKGDFWIGVIHGIEPSFVAREHAESLRLRVAEFRESYNGFSLFRHAIATEVLEHVEDPTTTLNLWREALVPDGYLALSVPNDNSPLQRLFGKWISPDRKTPEPWKHHTHLHYFNRRSLRSVVEASGFEVVWERTSFPVEILLAIPFMPRHWAWKLSRLWPAPPLLWRCGIGRHLLFVCKKAP